MGRFVLLVVFVLVVGGVGTFIGTQFTPGTWYETLNKPFFNPPGFLFQVVWPVLYLLIAVAGWRVFISQSETPGWGYWCIQMILNWAWSPVFFGAQLIFWGVCVIGGALLASLAFSAVTWEKDRLTSICFVPYIAWLSFALLLNVSIWMLN